jgi:hypothetical protein
MPRLPAGRLQKSSGLYEKKAVNQLKVALKSLYSRGYDDLLLEWKDNKLSAHQLIEASTAEEIEEDWGLLLLDCQTALLEWGTSTHYTKEGRRVHGHLVNQFADYIKYATISSLPSVLKQLKGHYKGSTVQFNKFRKLTLSFLKSAVSFNR